MAENEKRKETSVRLLGRSARGSLALALVWAPLRWRFGLCSFFRGSAFGLCQRLRNLVKPLIDVPGR